MQKAKSFSLARIVVAITLSMLAAIGWVIIADVFFNNEVSINDILIHGWYPLSLGLSAVIAMQISKSSLREMGLKRPEKPFLARVIGILLLLYAVPAIFNLVSGMVILDSRPVFNPLFLWAGLPGLLLFAFCEELMWRGVLYTEFTKIMSYTQSALVVGMLWALWHFPVLIHTRFIYADRPLGYVLPAFTLLVICASFIYTWLRHRTKSIWPGVLLHALMNYAGFVITMPLEDKHLSHSYFKGDIGISYLAIMLSGAIWAYMSFRKKQNRSKQ